MIILLIIMQLMQLIEVLLFEFRLPSVFGYVLFKTEIFSAFYFHNLKSALN